MNNVGNSPVSLCVVPTTELITVTPGSQIGELPRARLAKLLGIAGYMTAEITHSATTRQILGLAPTEIYDLDTAALVSANPVQIWYWTLGVQDVQGVNVNVGWMVEIDYDVEFFDRVEAPLS